MVKSKKLRDAETLIKNVMSDLQKLKEKNIVRSEKYFADYVEWAVCDVLNLKLANNSIQEGWDARDSDGKTYQIKYRTHKFSGGSAFDQIKRGKFDFLLGVFVNKNTYVVEDIIQVPHDIVFQKVPNSTNFKYTNILKNRLSFRWRKDTRKDPNIEHIYSNSK